MFLGLRQETTQPVGKNVWNVCVHVLALHVCGVFVFAHVSVGRVFVKLA